MQIIQKAILLPKQLLLSDVCSLWLCKVNGWVEWVARLGPKLRESSLLALSGRGAQFHATRGPPYGLSLYTFKRTFEG